jgi:hypothetical protein
MVFRFAQAQGRIVAIDLLADPDDRARLDLEQLQG